MHTPPFVRKNLSRNSAKIRFPEPPEAPALFISDSFRADQSQLPLKLVKPFLSTSADLVNSSPIFANFPLDIRLSPSKATGCILASLTICTLPAGAGLLCRKSALKHFAKEMVPWSLSKRLVCLTSGYRSFMISLPVFQRQIDSRERYRHLKSSISHICPRLFSAIMGNLKRFARPCGLFSPLCLGARKWKSLSAPICTYRQCGNLCRQGRKRGQVPNSPGTEFRGHRSKWVG